MPYAIEVKEGQEYWLCTCGKSGTGLCDGSHSDGKTANSPFCDGAHNS